MTSKVKAYILAALTAIGIAVAGLITYVQNTPVISDGAAGSVAPPAAGTVAPPVVVDAGHPQPPVVDAGHSQPSGFSAGAQSWFSDPSWGGSWPFRAGVNFATATASTVFNPQYLADAAPFQVYRHMDSNATNNSGQTTWASRRQPTDSTQIAYGANDGNGAPGWSYEWQLALCAQAGVDCWLNVPAKATDDHIAGLAALIAAKLPSNRKAIVEFSNEMAGAGWFTQTAYCKSQAAAAGMPGSNADYQCGSWQVNRTLQIARIMRPVVGSRFVSALCAVGNTDVIRQALGAAVYKSAKYNAQGTQIDMLCGSAYFGAQADGATYTLAAAKAEIDKLATGEDGMTTIASMAKAAGIPTTGIYEMHSSLYKNADKWAGSQAAADADVYLLDTAKKYVTGPACFYTLHATPGGGSAWGLLPSVGGSSMRYNSVKSWIASH